ncbi:MAG: ABC transporter substrate-binding protein [Candidatus Velthaea sp.]|jgi:NitT/TauT family transport system substrate-binding protein
MTISRSAFIAGTASVALLARGTAALAAPTPITLGLVPTSDLLPAILARDEGFFAKHDLDATIQILPVPPTVVGAIRGGSIQFGALTATAFLLANQGGLDFVAVSGAIRETRKSPRTSVVARTGSNIKTAADFVGKHVGVPGISSVLDVMFRYYLVQNKVDIKSVNIVEAPFATMPDMLKSGSLDAACSADPFRGFIIKSGIGYKVADYWSDIHDNALGLFWVSTREWATKNPAAIAAFRASLADGVAFSISNPDKSREDEVNAFKVATPLTTYDLSLSPADFTYYAGVLQALGMLHSPIDAAKDIV